MSDPHGNILAERYADMPFVSFGKHTYGDMQILAWDALTRLDVGDYCSFGPGTVAMLGGEHRPDWVTTFPFTARGGWPEVADVPGHPMSRGDISVGSDVWVGVGATLLSGARIGHGAVIGARTVVQGAVPPYAIVTGNPMRFVNWRFQESVRKALIEIAWWGWPEERLRKALPHLVSADIAAFIHKVQEGSL